MYNDGVPTYNYDRGPASASARVRTKNDFMRAYTELLKLQRKYQNRPDFARNFPQIDRFVKGVFGV